MPRVIRLRKVRDEVITSIEILGDAVKKLGDYSFLCVRFFSLGGET